MLSARLPALRSRRGAGGRWLAGAMCPSGGTGCVAGAMVPGAVGTLSPSDSDLLDPVGPFGTLSPSDSVGLYGMLSPSDPDSVGPVAQYGTLSPSKSDSVGLIGPYGTLSPSVPDPVDQSDRQSPVTPPVGGMSSVDPACGLPGGGGGEGGGGGVSSDWDGSSGQRGPFCYTIFCRRIGRG